MSQVLVVSYSHTGTCRRLAQLLCSQQGWPLAEIEDARPRAGAWGTLRCVLDSLLRRQPAIRYDGPRAERFDAVVLVSPIWVYRMAGPMRTFIAHNAQRLRNVSVISVMGSKGAPNAVAEVGALLDRSPMFTSAFLTREVDDGSCAARLQAFGNALRAAQEQHDAVRQNTWSPEAA